MNHELLDWSRRQCVGGSSETRLYFLKERQAINWMRDRLSRGRVFV
jgi:hypothetical protein